MFKMAFHLKLLNYPWVFLLNIAIFSLASGGKTQKEKRVRGTKALLLFLVKL